MAAMNRNRPGVDRLSLLPDEIICHILSFLSTKDAVVASVLCKRYRYLFASVPTIDLDYGLFWMCYEPRCSGTGKTVHRYGDAGRRFNKFINEMLISRSQINKFRIGYEFTGGYSINTSHVKSWILQAINRNVQMLEIGDNICFRNELFLPNELFHCRTLVSLKLLITRTVEVPQDVEMPNLKVVDVSFSIDASPYSITKSLHNLFPGCPVLEDLHIDCFILDELFTGVHVLYISIPSLKRLKLDLNCTRPEIIVDTPNLSHFDYVSDVDSKIEMKNLNCLVNARFTVSPVSTQSKNFSSLIVPMSHVTSLTLEVTEQLGWFFAHYSFPKFLKLKHLELHGVINDYPESLSVILDSMPALEFLVIDLGYSRSGIGDIEFLAPHNTPICFSQCLKQVEFRNFYGHQNDFELVKYILQCGEALTRMTICPSKERYPRWHGSCSKSMQCDCHSKSMLSVCEELLELTMSSKICQIVFAWG